MNAQRNHLLMTDFIEGTFFETERLKAIVIAHQKFYLVHSQIIRFVTNF